MISVSILLEFYDFKKYCYKVCLNCCFFLKKGTIRRLYFLYIHAPLPIIIMKNPHSPSSGWSCVWQTHTSSLLFHIQMVSTSKKRTVWGAAMIAGHLTMDPSLSNSSHSQSSSCNRSLLPCCIQWLPALTRPVQEEPKQLNVAHCLFECTL